MRTNPLFTERGQHFWSTFFTQPVRAVRLRPLMAGLGLALALVLNVAPAAHAFPISFEAHINGTDCLLVDAITAANTDLPAGDCAAGNPGADTIELLDNVTLFTAIGTAGLPEVNSAITINGNGFTIAGIDDVFGIMSVASSGNLTLNNTTITAGFGVFGGIYNAGTLTLNHSTVTGNSTLAAQTGGIMNYGVATLNHSTVSNNGEGGIDNFGPLTLNNSTVSGNTGPGITNVSMLTLSNSTVSGNTGYFGGGGINNAGTLTVSDSTVSDNSAFNSGGGIYNSGALTLERSLIAGNTAINGQEIFSAGCLSAASANTPDCLTSASAVNSADSNLFGHSGLTNAQAFSGFTPDGDDITATSDGTTPTALAAILDTTLQVNAPGNTATHALMTGSPAVDAASNGPATDQRGVARPQGSGFDIGAFELEQASNQPPAVAANNTSVTVDEGQTASNTGTVSDPDGDTVTLSASAGTVVNNGDGTWSWSFNTTDGPPDSQTVTITADDGNGGVSSTMFDLTVNNVAPTITTVSNDGPITAGGAANITVAASDPASAADPLAYKFDCDNNGSFEVGPQAGNSAACTFASAGSFPVNVQVSDGDGGVTPGSTVVTVTSATTPVGSCGGYAVAQTPGGSYVAPGWSGNIIVGNNGWNILFGSNNADLILGLGGFDDIFGLKGNDVICGGEGIDIIAGGDGDDLLYGDNHPDWLIGGEGNDTLHGGEGWDDLEGNSGQDALYGEAGFDVLLGGSHNDTLDGGDGPDYLEGGSGADSMSGGPDADALYGGNDNDTLAGNDGNDLLYGNNGSDTLDGGANNDLCKGGSGSDTIANCEGASSAAVEDDAADDKSGEADPLKLNDDNGANTIEQRVNQIFLPLVTR